MHTTRFPTPGYQTVAVIHNGDWSGDARVVWKDSEGNAGEAELPAKVLRSLGRQTARHWLIQEIISFLEQLEL